MKLNSIKAIYAYFSLVLVMTISVLGYGVYYFWGEGSIDLENVGAVYESGILVDSLKKERPHQTIGRYVNHGRVRDALVILEKKEDSFFQVNQAVETESYRKLKTSHEDLKDELVKLISFPLVNELVSVLGDKISNLRGFVIANNWKTLTRTTGKIRSYLSQAKSRSGESFRYSKMKILVKKLKRDISLMERVTSGSVLSESDKSAILSKLKTLNVELKMLEKYVSSLKSYIERYKKYGNSYEGWLREVGPALAYKRIGLEKSSKILMYGIVTLGAVLFLFFLIGIAIFKKSLKSARASFEKSALNIIKNNLIPYEHSFEKRLSNEFVDEFLKLKNYIHRRMSFGSIFQESTPFPAGLFDSNLNLVWANHSFYDSWGINKENSFTWDFLQQFTNFEDNDPVVSAVKNDIAGIYQMQLRGGEDKAVLPYEMYISPVEHGGQKRIMIFLYPLITIEETILNQSRSIVGPVSRTLDQLMVNDFTSEFREKIYKDFDIAGISDLFDKFKEYFEKVSEEKESLLIEIDELEKSLSRAVKNSGVNANILNEISSKNSKEAELFSIAKNNIVSAVELRADLESLFQNTFNVCKGLFKDKRELVKNSVQVNEILEENNESIKQISKQRDVMKSFKVSISDVNRSLIQSFDQFMIFQKQLSPSMKLDESINKIKNEIKGFSDHLSKFEKSISTLDLTISKVEQQICEHQRIDFEKYDDVFEHKKELIESDMFHVNKDIRDAENLDEQMISNLKSMFQNFRYVDSKVLEAKDIITMNLEDNGILTPSTVANQSEGSTITSQ